MKRKILYLTFAISVFIFTGCNDTATNEIAGNDLKTEAALNVTEDTTENDDLLYRQIQGSSISLAEGEEIHVSIGNTESYQDVCIFLIGQDIVQKIGTLDSSTPFSFQASVSGEYVIYAGGQDVNITDQVTVEFQDSKDSGDSLMAPL